MIARMTLSLALLMALANPALAGVAPTKVPGQILVEGQLATAAGTTVMNGTYNVTLRLYKQQVGGDLLWQEGPLAVVVEGGVFAIAAGETVPVHSAIFANGPELWLSIQVDPDPEMPRQPMRSVPFALRAGLADGLQCSGCVTAGMLDAAVLAGYAKTVDLATFVTATDLGAYVKTADLVAYAKVADLAEYAKTTDLSAYAKLADLIPYAKTTDLASYATLAQLAAYALISDLSGYAKKADLALVATTGKYSDLLELPSGQALPPDGLAVVSNGLLTNQFTNTFESLHYIPINDYPLQGAVDSIVVPADLGTVQKLTVSVVINDTDISGMSVKLMDPNNAVLVLYDDAGAGVQLVADYPVAAWTGKPDAKGTWKLVVTDTKSNGGPDVVGGLKSWKLTFATLSTGEVEATKNLVVTGLLSGPGKVLSVDGILQVSGHSVARVWTATSDALADGASLDVATGLTDELFGVTGWVGLSGGWRQTSAAGELATACTACGNGADLDYYVATGSVDLQSGTHNFRTFRIEQGCTVTVVGTAPLVINVIGQAKIAGTLRLRGNGGLDETENGNWRPDGPFGQAGGGDGGPDGPCGSVKCSMGGPGGGMGGGAAGYRGGGAGHATNGVDSVGGGKGGAAYGDPMLTGGLEGGAGGGGAQHQGETPEGRGQSGGAGGGAVKLTASQIVIESTGAIDAAGGKAGSYAGGGSGGSIWLRATDVQVLGSLSVEGGKAGPPGGNGAAGRIRIDGTVTGSGIAAAAYASGPVDGLGSTLVNRFPVSQPSLGTVRITNNSGGTQKVRLVVTH